MNPPTPPEVRLHRHARLEPVDPGDVLRAVGVGPQGQALALWSRAGGTACVTVHTPARTQVVLVRDEAAAAHFVQPLGPERVLLVGAVCQWREEGPDLNAFVLDAQGEPVAAGTLGNGIEHVLTTAAGDIWVGYFDEGVYGSAGWGGPGPEPIGAPGIVRWTGDLELAWQFGHDTGFGVVDDCYGLNVDGETAWAHYYNAFPIVRIDGDAVTGWRTDDRRGATALIVSGSSAGLLGGYRRRDQDRVVVGELSDGAFVAQSTARLVMDDGSPLPAVTRFGRGPALHVFAGTDWYRTDLDEIAPRRRT